MESTVGEGPRDTRDHAILMLLAIYGLRSGEVQGLRLEDLDWTHDLRHSFAVHRLTTWYRDGADVLRLLPKLSTYLGHVHISGTQRYLTLTPELLREAGLRFERYAMESSHD